ncbi:DUF4012 domain-containing protein [Methanobacterium petrolearium]|uniref:DUF4012 domain-containing protein n=1 Tax=Methanobacterium petrolearium TaxID=710190 RepID=UPI001AE1AF0D|nr:DUF4012 domain-containing protein [Methanobacterium petrolearium]MBP1947043.1 anionic cell wall polymer biosynthesis LytR-Cps2A-Psr (LCP) family protein [Methanobacterium petrolearium]BDZ72091.1 hypothetical protein GCM10025861_26080 [Methanobacterium petrolearium]
MVKKKTFITIVVLLILVSGFIFTTYEHLQAKEVNTNTGEMNILILCVDPSESKAGVGGVDAIVILKIKNWHVNSFEPIFPGHIYHPTATPPQDLQEHLMQYKIDPSHYYLHDCFWEGDTQAGAKLASEALEYSTGIKTNFVITINPDAVDAIIQAVGPVYVTGQGYINGNSIELIRDEMDNQDISRRKSVNSLFHGILKGSHDKSKYPALIYAIITQYIKGNIIVVL